jgi:two-component system response regulator YesN
LEDLLRFVIKNIAGELFAPYDQDIILIEHDKMIYNMIIYSTKESSMEYINVIHQLEIFKAELETYLKGKIACYIGEGINLNNINDQKRKLSILMDKNLAMKNKVYQISELDHEKREEEGLQYIPQYERWIRYIKQNLYETARNEICDYLNYLSEHNEISHETLTLFQMNLIRLMNVIAEEKNIQPQIIYKKYLLDEVYVNSTKSLESMQIFADAIIDTAEELYKDEIEILDKVNMVRRYINDNIEKDIKRIDIANHLHLNIDYLNRVFKKETGLALNEYIVVEKMNIARHLIRTTMLPISFIAARIGISNFSHFSKIYKRTFQISPSEERRSKS